MLRLSLLRRQSSSAPTGSSFLKKAVPAAAAAAHPVPTRVNPELEASTVASNEVFGMRRAPKSLYGKGMKSQALSENPLTLREAARNAHLRRQEFENVRRVDEWQRVEADARSKLAASSSSPNAAAAAAAAAAPELDEAQLQAQAEADALAEEGARASVMLFEHRLCAFAMLVGFLLGHAVVYKRYYPEDVRLEYKLDQGFTKDLLRRREELADLDEFVGLRVMGNVVDAKRAKFKQAAAAA